ncbi:dihydrofolate reductase [Candidatus Roizmanbacteria bacterium]|nr:dihydrofolate reductase [Candidatus Roizmanbacteria bacterium]
MPTISLIAAIDRNRGLGKDNKIPWHIPEDLKHFKEITMGHPVIMGRKTFESIGKPLPGRVTIVVTRNPNYACGVRTVHSLDDAISYATSLDQKEIFIIGGAEIFKQSIHRAHKLYLTIIDAAYEVDTYFPAYEETFTPVKEDRRVNGNVTVTYKTFKRKDT